MLNGFALRIIVVATCVLLAGCVKAPLELRTALERQAAELQQIDASYTTNIDSLLNSLEKLQMDYLDEAEQRLREKYLHEGKIGEKVTPASDPKLLVIRLESVQKIDAFFKAKREAVRSNFVAKRKEFMKLRQSLDNAAQINDAMKGYVDSVIRLRKAQDTFGNTLLERVSALPAVPPITGRVVDEVIRVTNEEFENFTKTKP
jgi:hypothetical protein